MIYRMDLSGKNLDKIGPIREIWLKRFLSLNSFHKIPFCDLLLRSTNFVTCKELLHDFKGLIFLFFSFSLFSLKCWCWSHRRFDFHGNGIQHDWRSWTYISIRNCSENERPTMFSHTNSGEWTIWRLLHEGRFGCFRLWFTFPFSWKQLTLISSL